VGLACDITVTLLCVVPIHDLDQADTVLSPKVSTQGTGQGFRWLRQPDLWAGRISYNLGVCGVFFVYGVFSFFEGAETGLSVVMFHYT